MTSTQLTYKYVIATALAVFFCSFRGLAQEQNQYDRGTPPQHAAGVSSLGSYTAAELGNINLSNGALNFTLPLGSIGGRGFSIPLTLNYSSKIWSASTDTDEDHAHTQFRAAFAEFTHSYSSAGFYGEIGAGWSVGAAPSLANKIVRIKRIASGPNIGCYTYTLPKLTLQLPGFGEIEFRDDIYDGAPLLSDCSGLVASSSRGTRWHATDGSGMVYISNTDNAAALQGGNLTGVIITSNGTRYSIDAGGRCSLITDRNGNRITISYISDDEIQYVDQLGRLTKIQKTVTDPENPGVTLTLLVTVPGYNGANRYYKIKSGLMSQHYRSDISPTLPVITGDYDPLSLYPNQSGTKLFPLSYAGFFQRIDNRAVLSEVELPDHRSLRFKYNKFGEVAEAELPTGGKIWYEFQSSFSLPGGNSPEHETTAAYHTTVPIDRALSQRKTFADGTTLDCTWSYAYSDTWTNVTATSATGTLMLNETHHFLPAGRYTEAPGGSAEVHDGTYYALWSTGIEWRTETKDASGAVIGATEKTWTQREPVAWPTYPAGEQPAKDNRVNSLRNILDDGKVATIGIVYDQFNNPIETSEFDFGNVLKRRTVTTYSATNLVNGVNYAADAIHLLRLPLQRSIYDGAYVEQARITYEYDIYSGEHHSALQYYDAIVTSHDTANYGVSKTTRGNATRSGVWIQTSNSYLYSYPRYDILGNVVSLKDPGGNISTINFTDDFGIGSSPGMGAQGTYGATYALPTLFTSAAPNPGEQPHSANVQYDFSTGLLTGAKDPNNVITQTIYDDPFNRPTLVKAALGVSGLERHAVTYYAPATIPEFPEVILTGNDVLTVGDQASLDDRVLRSWTVTDGFGRTKEGWSHDPQGDVKVVGNYDPLGRAFKSSNPFRPSLGQTPVYTTSVYDLAGRVISTTTPDGAVVTSEFAGNVVTVTDQAGKKRRSVWDGLSRLTRVDEPDANNSLGSISSPFQPTEYSYDALGNLIHVTQGSQHRYFKYDSLSRPIRSRNPEQSVNSSLDLPDPLTGNSQWSLAYQYDNNGNLTQRIDARGVTSNFGYDALNRNTSVNYTNDPANTPSITRTYDGAINGKGKLWKTETSGTSASRTTIDSYDVLGRPTIQRQQFYTASTWSQSYTAQRSYDLAGHVITQTYPSGHSVNYSYDVAGRTSSFSGNLGEGITRTYASDFQYSPNGALQQEKFGTATPLYHKQRYNVRGQLWDMRLSTVPFNIDPANGDRGTIVNHYSNNYVQGGSGSDNNGNLLRQEIYIPGSSFFQDNFTYDSLNRLKSISEKLNGTGNDTFKQTYSYLDRWGNRTIDQANTSGVLINNLQFSVDPANNRLGVPQGLPYTMGYDAAGNLTNDTYTGGGQRTFDAENRMITAHRPGKFPIAYYTYNGDGQRVRSRVSNYELWQIYGFDGELVAEYLQFGPSVSVAQPGKEYGYCNGQLLVTAEPFTNLALNKPATQTDNYNPTTTASKAVDGDADGDLGDGHTSATNSYANSWWQVDLQSVQTIASITAWGRTDCCPEMSSNVYVFVSDNPFTSYDLNTTINQAGVSNYLHSGYAAPASIPINRTGRYVRVQLVGTNNLALAEVQVWSQAAKINWVVTDHLGTPRMVVDKTGAAAGITRHDYLPFGEELIVGQGARTTAQGYVSDSLRQKFTSKERDNETGLDYFLARYYSSKQGRFTSVDPLMASARVGDPQSWNRYAYVLNKPTKLTDPFGLESQDRRDTKLPKEMPLCTVPVCILDPIAELWIVAPTEPIAVTDIQIVTQLQLATGLQNPLPPDGAAVQMLDSIASGRANGVLAGTVAVGTLGSGGTNLPAGAAVATGVVLGVAAYDLIRAIADAISRAIPRSAPPDLGVPLYRGVAADHPGFAAALGGAAIPIGGHDNPALHNAGNTTSIFTSWTSDPAIAGRFAGSGGVVLFKNIERARIAPSPDAFQEREVLVIGVVTGASVRRLP